MQEQHVVDQARVAGGDESVQRRDRAVQPERVAVYDEEWIGTQQVQRGPDPSAGIEQGGFAAHQDGGGVAGGEVGLDLVGVPEGVHHDAFHSGCGEPVERVIQQGAAAEGQQRLGGAVGQRTHAGAQPGGEHHGAVGADHAAGPGGLQRRSGAAAGKQPAAGIAGWQKARAAGDPVR